MEVKKLLEINDCTDCMHYNRVDYNNVFWIECGLTKTVLFDEFDGVIEKQIPSNCPLPNSDNKILNQLDEWISLCEIQEDIFKQNNMEISELSSGAMKQAYKNVKNFIKK
jgi:hypothetical protein